jgi:hypothetical protein
MSTDDDFRKQATEAQSMADRAISPVDKEAWLRIAKGFMGLIRKPMPTALETFDAAAKARGTGQDSSDKSN